ncbi:MAG: metallophosphoesterase [Candidatus Bipolaricaulota bacterium]
MSNYSKSKTGLGFRDLFDAMWLAILLLVWITMFLVASPVPGAAESRKNSYSFVVFGDSRIPAYAPYDKKNKKKLDELIHAVTRYAYSGQKEPPYEAFYNPNTLQLERIELPGEKEGQSRTITYGRDGWPDVFLNREVGKAQVSLLASGQEWVYDNVVREVREGVKNNEDGPSFVLHTGDIVYFGFQGKSAEESPYWQDFDRRFFSRLPDGGPGNLSARFFPVLGNHETWGDENIIGFREMFPYLNRYGFNVDNRVYQFDYKNARFIFLDSGIMDPEAPADWYKSTPSYETQMNYLTSWLEEAIADGKDHAFLTLHYPVFSRSGFGPLPEEHNPHSLLKSYADKVDITVFTGHNHATEAYSVDGVRYFVVGGGGGEQSLSSNWMPEDYPEDHYWKGNEQKLDYNYLLVEVEGDDVSVIVKHFRPNELEPYGRVNLVPDRMD